MSTAILPPWVIDVRVRERDKRSFRIWLPFFLLWPLLFVLAGFALLVALLVDIALFFAGTRYHYYTLLLLYSLHTLAQVRGTRAYVNSRTTLVEVKII